jgi:hypothetical protein
VTLAAVFRAQGPESRLLLPKGLELQHIAFSFCGLLIFLKAGTNTEFYRAWRRKKFIREHFLSPTSITRREVSREGASSCANANIPSLRRRAKTQRE